MYRLLAFVSFGASVAWMYTAPNYDSFIAIIATVAALVKDEIHGFIGARRVSLNARRGVIGSLKNSPYSFTRDIFVNPFIIRDLYGWLSDTGDQVVEINISGANKSNRYFAEQTVTNIDGGMPIVTAKHEEQVFSYQYLGRSFTGIHLLHISDRSGGSGAFGAIIFVTLSYDAAVELSPSSAARMERLVVKKIGSLPLGDRYDGRIRYRYGLLYIGRADRHETIRTSSQWLIVL